MGTGDKRSFKANGSRAATEDAAAYRKNAKVKAAAIAGKKK